MLEVISLGYLSSSQTILNDDSILMISAFGAIALITAVIQLTGSTWSSGRSQLRKLLHCSSILICAYVIHEIEDIQPLIWIFLAFSLILFWVVKTQLLNISEGRSLGIALFPLAFGILLMMEGIPRSNVVMGALVLAIADPLASLVGQRFSRSSWTPLNEQKSLLGSIVFLITAILILGYFSAIWNDGNLNVKVIGGVCIVATLSTFSEMFSWRGSDNFCIPLVAASCLTAISIHSPSEAQITLLVVIAFGLLLVKMKWLTLAGAMAVVMMATWISLLIGWYALILPVVFLIIGSLVSRLNTSDRSLARDDSKGRTAHQVFANGGMGMLIGIPYLLTHNDLFLFLYALVFVTTMSDTVSSEIGRYYKGMTYDLRTLRKVSPGISGGVSWKGTVAGLIGSLLLSSIAFLVFDLTVLEFLWLTILGFSGMLIDSLMGAHLQGKYVVHGILSEEGRPDQLVSGVHWIDNSMVNFLSVLAILAIGLLIV